MESGGVKGRGSTPQPRPCTRSMTTEHSTPGGQGPRRGGWGGGGRGHLHLGDSQCLFPEAVSRRKAGCIQPVKLHAGPAPISAGGLRSTPTERETRGAETASAARGAEGPCKGPKPPSQASHIKFLSSEGRQRREAGLEPTQGLKLLNKSPVLPVCLAAESPQEGLDHVPEV